ncbi:YbaK/EbsC family protein [Actinomyces sp. F1_1611]
METISAASVLLTDSEGRVLLVQRGHHPQQGRWSLPGGSAEPGETSAEAARREAREETGFEVEVGREVVTATMADGPARQYDVHCFAARVVGGQLKPGDDAVAAHWVRPEDLAQYELTTGLIESLRTAGYLPPEPAGATRVRRAAQALGLEFDLTEYGPARSLVEAAERRGIGPEQLLKTLVVRQSPTEFVLVLVPGGRKISWPKLRAQLGVSRLSLASEEEALAATGFVRGTITPVGSSHPWPVLLDESAPAGPIGLGGGAPGWGLRVDRDQLRQRLDARVVDVSEPEG